MRYPSQLDAVQAWLLGYIDRAQVLDLDGDSRGFATAMARAEMDTNYANALIAEAQGLLERESPFAEPLCTAAS